jgi:hypothetical protein
VNATASNQRRLALLRGMKGAPYLRSGEPGVRLLPLCRRDGDGLSQRLGAVDGDGDRSDVLRRCLGHNQVLYTRRHACYYGAEKGAGLDPTVLP